MAFSGGGTPPNIAVLVTTYNRVNVTKIFFNNLLSQISCGSFTYSVFVFDDGSQDGTQDYLSTLGGLKLITDGCENYWAASMSKLETYALSGAKHDYVLWLNDDVFLFEGGLKLLENAMVEYPGEVLIGACLSDSGKTSYSGLKKAGFHPLSFELIEPNGTYQNVDTFNGNIVCIPTSTIEKMGGIDGGYRHSLADIDFGLRLSNAGLNALLMPYPLGQCNRNDNSRRTIKKDFLYYFGPKGSGNIANLRRFARKHCNFTEKILLLLSLVKWILRRILSHA